MTAPRKSHETMISITTSLLAVMVSLANAAPGKNLTADHLETWLKGYEEAWETLDPDKAAALFTADATYRDDPYKEPHRGREGIREYWSTVTADQKDVDFTFQVLAVTRSTGIAHWHAEFSSRANGAGITLDGIFVLEFDARGLCRSLKEWWHLKIDPATERKN